MDEDELPAWLVQAARDASEHARLLQPYVKQARYAAEVSRSMMPLARYAKDYAEQAQSAADLAQSMMPLARYARDYAEQAQSAAAEMARSMVPLIRYAQENAENLARAMAIAGPLLAYADQVKQAMDVGMAGIGILASQPPAPRHHTRSANLTITPVLTATAVVTKATRAEVATPLQDPPIEAAHSINVVAFALVLLWMWAVTVPAAQLLLPPEAQEYLNGLYTTVGIALAVTWRLQDKRKG